MKTRELRNRYLEFFKKKDHKIFPSDSLVPLDPTVLFTSAGMNQFKPYFLGEKKDVQRATSVQKCLRTGDIDEVGKTAYHHTFFEMLGNFSFGDYFKKEAIEFAWEFLTKDLNMKEEDLCVSVYLNDDEAFSLWEKHIGLSKKKISLLGEDKNFWPASAPTLGPNGPCGPCSEVFFDRGTKVGCGKKECSPACDCGRFVEVWNLVFTQFNRVALNSLEPLPQKNIDTGMGLERMASVLQQKESNFQIDILAPAVTFIKEMIGKNVAADQLFLINAIVDHARAATFAISDGIFPSNEERGYVVRKLIRKASWTAYTLGKRKPFLYRTVGVYGELMKDAYPDILKNTEKISGIILAEEEKLLSSVASGKEQLQVVISETKSEGSRVIRGEAAFRLYDTFGFPLELLRQVVAADGLEVDEKGFIARLEKQRNLSRKGSKFEESIFTSEEYAFSDSSEFIGYKSLSTEAGIVRLLNSEKKEIDSLDDGQEGILILDRTPFYAEGGGQLSDRGVIVTHDGEFRVDDVQRAKDAALHIGKAVKGTLKKTTAYATVDRARRVRLMRAHTATHLLQSVLREVLGDHVAQQGSLVDEDRFRFDFTHFKRLEAQELDRVEQRINELILEGDAVQKNITTLSQAKEQGALAFFKEKYADEVRVVSIAGYSKELCGGTHLDTTQGVGLFVITNENSISSGIRRIEAVVGEEALKKFLGYKHTVKELSHYLKTSEGDLVAAVRDLGDNAKKLRTDLGEFEKELFVGKMADAVVKDSFDVAAIKVMVYRFSHKDYPLLLHLSDELRNNFPQAVTFFVSSLAQREIFVCSAGKELTKKKFSCKEFVASYGSSLGLRGGGKDSAVQGVIEKPKEFKEFKKEVSDFLKEYCTQCVS